MSTLHQLRNYLNDYELGPIFGRKSTTAWHDIPQRCAPRANRLLTILQATDIRDPTRLKSLLSKSRQAPASIPTGHHKRVRLKISPSVTDPTMLSLLHMIEESSLNVLDVSRLSGVIGSTIYRWFNGSYNARMVDFAAVAQALGAQLVLVPPAPPPLTLMGESLWSIVSSLHTSPPPSRLDGELSSGQTP